MSTTTSTPGIKVSFTATVTVDQYLLTSLGTDGTVSVATATSAQTEVGFADRKIDAGTTGTVQLLNGGGSALAVAAATITTGDTLYPATGGGVSSATFTDSPVVGIALQDAVADDVIEILLPY
jgi:hypothetical protein